MRAALIPLLLLAPAAGAIPSADFELHPINGPVCLAPCAVLVDAVSGAEATSDPDYTRLFHSLQFEWDFGDPSSGVWPLGAARRAGEVWFRNYEVGPVAGHLYESPGSYIVTLTVTNPAGQVGQTNDLVRVVDPDAHFAAADTFCFANDSSGWTGCPLDCAGEDAAHCIVTADFDEALEGEEGCDFDGVPGRRCLFRAGDRFTQDVETMNSPFQNSEPSLLSSFGDGVFTIDQDCGSDCPGFGFATSGDLTIWERFVYDASPECEQDGVPCSLFASIGGRVANVVIHDVTGNGLTSACVEQAVADAPHQLDMAFVGMACNHAGTDRGAGHAAGFFSNGSRMLYLGNRIDGSYTAEFNHRYRGGSGTTCGFDKGCLAVIAHNRYERPDHGLDGDPPSEVGGDPRSNLQLRGPVRYTVVQDNVFSNRDTQDFVKICAGNAGCGADAVATSDHLIAFNFMFRELGGEPAGFQSGAVEVQGADVTVRNNVFDYQGFADVGIATRVVSKDTSNAPENDGLHVLNNSVYFPETNHSPLVLCSVRNTGNASAGSGHLCKGNLVYVPGQLGPLSETDDPAAFTTEGNRLLTSGGSPFDRNGDGIRDVPPGQSLTSPADFQLLGTADAADAGPDYSSATTHYVYRDALRGCRPLDAPSDEDETPEHDVGAFEFESAACRAGGPTEPVQAPVLLCTGPDC